MHTLYPSKFYFKGKGQCKGSALTCGAWNKFKQISHLLICFIFFYKKAFFPPQCFPFYLELASLPIRQIYIGSSVFT